MKVTYTIAGEVEVPDGTPLEALKEELVTALVKSIHSETVTIWIDEHLVEYDPVVDYEPS